MSLKDKLLAGFMPAKSASKKEADVNPDAAQTDGGDYGTHPDKGQAADNAASANETQQDITVQRNQDLSDPADLEDLNKISKVKKAAMIASAAKVLKKTLASSGMSEAKVTEKVQAFVTKAKEIQANDSVEDFKQKLVDQSSDLIVDQIFETNPEEDAVPDSVGEPLEEQAPAPAEDATQVDQTQEQEAVEENQDAFGTPPISVSTSAKPAPAANVKTAEGQEDLDPAKTVETAPGAVESNETDGEKENTVSDTTDPADQAWDLFPEDNITTEKNDANAELNSDAKESLKEASAFVKKEGDSIFVTEAEKMALAHEVATALMENGLNETATLESESARLFLMDPAELRAHASIMARFEKKASFKHPQADDSGILKQALSLGNAQPTEEEDSIFW